MPQILTLRLERDKGATMLEFLFSVAFLLFFTFISISLLYVCYASVTLQFVATRMLRTSVLGSAVEGGKTHTEQMEDRAIEMARQFRISLTNADVHICTVQGTTANIDCAVDNAEESGRLITIHLTKTFAIPIYGFGDLTVEGLALGRNEPF